MSGEIKMLVIEKMDTFSLEGNHFSRTQDAEQFSVSPKKINFRQVFFTNRKIDGGL